MPETLHVVKGYSPLLLALISASQKPVTIRNFDDAAFRLKERGFLEMRLLDKNLPETVITITKMGKEKIHRVCHTTGVNSDMTAPQQAELGIVGQLADSTLPYIQADVTRWLGILDGVHPTGSRPIDKQMQALKTGLTVAQLALEELTN